MTAQHSPDEIRSVDVVVVGSGVAGSSAALTAARAGARVALLEKLPTFGGSAALSAGMFWTAPTAEAYRARIPLGRTDLGDRLVADYDDALAELRSSGARVADEPQRDIMTFGVGYATDIRAILAWCRDEVLAAGGQVLTDTSVLRLLSDERGTTGVLARTADGSTVTISAPSVVLATGGFQGDPAELSRHMGRNADRLLVRSNPGSVGDGLRLARHAGAAGTGAMSTFYGHLIACPVDRFEPADFLPTSQYYSDSAVLVNLRGERFADERLGDEILNQDLTWQPDARGVLIFDDHVRRTEATSEPFPGLGAVDRFQHAVDLGARHVTAQSLPDLVAELAAWGVDQETLSRTLTGYEQVALDGGGVSLGVPVAATARPARTGPFHALLVQPSITFTFGGIRTDAEGRALDADGRPMVGLFAAGADIGGLSNYGYAGGLAPGYVTGRWAGRSAAAHAADAADAADATDREQRVVVVGASSGMGAAIAARLTGGGATVIGLDLPDAVWPEDSPLVDRVSVDVADPESVDAAMRVVADRLGGIDVVVNCAGILGPVVPTVQVDQQSFEKILRVNLGGSFAVTRAALSHMLPAGYGRIVHIASIAGKEGNPQMAAYSASKAGVIGLVKSVGKEYATSGVTINAVAPASVETPLIAGMSPERQAVQRDLIPMGRFGTVAEIAALVEFITSADASFTTGFVYDASGGRASY